ncbi:MAG: SDR family NAD(P)-dependent oxidoreductase [Alphaproteobacteria bacterium]|nr:SDR family NAD(P)-dependent oxidoreductase [Alphaproteobacteria bacterium]
MLDTFGDDLNIAVFGATGGIGGAFVAALAAQENVRYVHACARDFSDDRDKVTGVSFDLTDEDSIEAAAERLEESGPLHIVLVATGTLHGQEFGPEKRWRDLDAHTLEHLFRVNTIGPALIAKHTLGRLARDRKTVFAALSARVGSIEDNELGGWHGYRASKAALNMMLRTCSVELAHRNPDAVCIALHPGTVDTGLSKPFQRSVPEGNLFSPEYAATRLLDVIDGLGSDDTGGFFAWDGKRIPY